MLGRSLTLHKGKAALLVGWLVACGGTEARFLSPETVMLVQLQQYEQRSVGVRYLDSQGAAVQGAIRFRLEGATNGALLQTPVARTDPMGIGRATITAGGVASFILVASADGAAELRFSIQVAEDAGGEVEVRIGAFELGDGNQARVTLTDDLNCSGVDFTLPPPGAGGVAQSTRTTYLSSTGGVVVFGGLRADRSYGVVAIVTVGGDPVAGGCVNNITLSQQEIDAKQRKTVTLQLHEVTPEISDDDLLVTTRFEQPLRLTHAAALLGQVAADPLQYVVDRTLANAGQQPWVTALTNAKEALVAHLRQRMPNLAQAQSRLGAVASGLEKVTDLRMVTTMAVADETADDRESWAVTHSFAYFLGTIDGQQRKYRASAAMSGIFGLEAPALVLQAQTTMRQPTGATSVTFDEHTLSIPLGVALFGTLLLDQFNDYNLLEILRAQLDCLAAGSLAREFYEANLQGNDAALVEQGMREGCEATLTSLSLKLRGEVVLGLQLASLEETVPLQGKAYLSRRPGGQIDEIKNGTWGPIDGTNEWAQIGTFTARRGDEWSSDGI